jgi:hypothetical protein
MAFWGMIANPNIQKRVRVWIVPKPDVIPVPSGLPVIRKESINQRRGLEQSRRGIECPPLSAVADRQTLRPKNPIRYVKTTEKSLVVLAAAGAFEK